MWWYKDNENDELKMNPKQWVKISLSINYILSLVFIQTHMHLKLYHLLKGEKINSLFFQNIYWEFIFFLLFLIFITCGEIFPQ